MKTYLLPPTGKFYKANLHAHTDMSDGTNSPEEVKEIFRSMGYSIVAYTDHDVFVDRSHLCEDDFLALNGVEEEINGRNFGSGWLTMETCHLNFIALEQDNLLCPCYHRSKYFYANAPKYRHLVQYDASLPDFERSYTGECISAMLREGRERGFYTVYNHPTGSLENYPLYSRYENMHAMEIYNGVWADDSQAYDDLLRLGRMIHCVGGDDSHSREGSGFAWTVIKAEALTYRAVTDALLRGNFYASRGPEIYELYAEDGVLHVRCSDAQAILFASASRSPGRKYVRADAGHTIREAEFRIPSECGYVRVVVIGPDGKTASTNAYSVNDLLP
ncbi:MAG: hypothetical protein E7662_05810 [Ruminococcaceae bacterium]|nr:hypothetical protein [Oscillospiraceae bacterium]